MWQSMDVYRTKMELTFVKLDAAYYGMWQSMIYKYYNVNRKITPFERLGWLAPARQLANMRDARLSTSVWYDVGISILLF